MSDKIIDVILQELRDNDRWVNDLHFHISVIENILNKHLSIPKAQWFRAAYDGNVARVYLPKEEEQEETKAEIKRLKEIPTKRTSMIEYLKWEKITWFIGRKYGKKEVKAYNDWIETSIQMIASCMTKLVEQEDTTPIEQLEARVKYIEDTIHKIMNNNLKIREKLNVLIEDYNRK